MTTGNTIALTRWMFVSKVTSLLFNVRSRFVIVFLQRSKASFNFMTAVTVLRVLLELKKQNLPLFPLFPRLFAMK